jgi:GxxExxY protein
MKTYHGDTETRREPISAELNAVADDIVDSAFKVHSALGPGLLESVCEICLAHELTKRSYKVRRRVEVPVVYDGIRFDTGFRLDLIVNELVIIEVKAVEDDHPVHEAQLLSHMKLLGKRLGFLINFNVPLIKQGIKRRAR